MARLKPSTIKKLRGLYRFWLKEPRRLAMSDWGAVFDPNNKAVKEAVANVIDWDTLDGNDMPPCGTVGCIAGTIVLLNTPKEKLDRMMARACKLSKEFVQGVEDGLEPDSTESAVFLDADVMGRRLLGLNKAQSDRLFMPGDWPGEFQDLYDEADTPLKRVYATIRRIEYFIFTGGTDDVGEISIPKVRR